MAEMGFHSRALRLLASGATAARLAGFRQDWVEVDAQMCAALDFRLGGGGLRCIGGLIGGASAGKSTLFNSLMGEEASRVSGVAHETVGPIAACHELMVARVTEWIDRGSMFTDLGHQPSGAAPSIGRCDAVTLHGHARDDLGDVMLLDLPDVTSQMSIEEGAVTHRLMPWFDVLILVIDEERWFDAEVFASTVSFARDFGPSIHVLFNATEAGRSLSEDERRRLEEHAAAHRADGCAFSPYRPGTGYRPLDDSVRRQVVEWLRAADTARRSEALNARLRRRCADVVRVNVRRAREYDQLLERVEREIKSSASETRLTIDLLTEDERAMLGVGHRWMPLLGALRALGRRTFGGDRRSAAAGVDFDKRTDELAALLRCNLEQRFQSVTDRVQIAVLAGAYGSDDHPRWTPVWRTPAFDEREWARRIRTHIDSWRREAGRHTRRSDTAVLSVGLPLLLADLLFLGGAGVSLLSAAAWAAGMVAGKGLAHSLQRSTAFADYRATVDAYAALVRESIHEQWTRNLADLPRRHMAVQDPLLQAMMTLAASQEV